MMSGFCLDIISKVSQLSDIILRPITQWICIFVESNSEVQLQIAISRAKNVEKGCKMSTSVSLISFHDKSANMSLDHLDHKSEDSSFC